MKNDVAAIIQARTGSTRLPGKALKKIGDYTMTEFLVRRVASALAAEPLLALPEGPGDDELAAAAAGWPCEIVRGSEDDVLGRFGLALEKRPDAEIIIRVTGDNPLLDPGLLQKGTELLRNSEADWGSFKFLPLGIGTGFFRREWLERAVEEAQSDFDREHVTTWIKNHPDSKKASWLPPEEYRAPGLRLTVDTDEDFELIEKLLGDNLVAPEDVNSAELIAKLARNPKLALINRHIDQKHRVDKNVMLVCLNRGEEWGWGHWSRMETLYRFFQKLKISKKMDFYALAGVLGDSAEHPRLIKQTAGELKREDIEEWALRTGANTVVLDVKNSSEKLVWELKAFGERVIGIEDTGSGRKLMDYVIDSNLYEGVLQNDEVAPAARGYGPDHAIIDPCFFERALKVVPQEINRVGVFFGGSDPAGLRNRVANLAALRADIEFHLFGPRPELPESDLPDNLILRGMVKKTCYAFSEMDFMLISGGITKFEIAALGLGAIIVAQHEEQYVNSERFIEKNDLRWQLLEAKSRAEEWQFALDEANDFEKLSYWHQNGPLVVEDRGISKIFG